MSAIQLVPGDDGNPAGWARILAQECQEYVVDGDPVTRVALVDGCWPDWWESFLQNGGVVIATGMRRLPWESKARPVVSMTQFEWPGIAQPIQAPSLAVVATDLEGTGTVRIHDERVAKDAGTIDASVVVSRHAVGAGLLLVCWVPLGSLLDARGDRPRRFSRLTEVTERVSSVDKAEVGKVLVSLLTQAVTWLGLPYARPVYSPDGVNVAVVRIDVDGVFGEKTKKIDHAFGRRGMPVSFFVNGRLSDQHPGTLQINTSMHQLGQHGYWHDVFSTAEENQDNLRRGARWLQDRTGRRPDGFVAPRGLWNEALETALIAEGYDYSSDFGLDFDSLPFRTGAGILQLPVHPYSPERAARYWKEAGARGLGREADLAHYRTVVQQRAEQGLPAYVYGHPERFADIAEELAQDLVRMVRDSRVRLLTVRDYAAWWRRRESVRIRLEGRPEQRGDLSVVEADSIEDHALQVRTSSGCRVRIGGSLVDVAPQPGWTTVRDGAATHPRCSGR